MNKRSLFQDALRLMFILVHGAMPLSKSKRNEPDAHSMFTGKARLHAMDFWVRYPDYLAHELLNLYRSGHDEGLLRLAEEILDKNEPDLRHIPMIRYRFGAYERIDDAMSVLVSKGLVRLSGKKHGHRVQETDYLIMKRCSDLISEIVRDFPELRWYEDRTRLVAQIAAGRNGNALKRHQYKHISYAQTKLGGIIPSIVEEVRRQITELRKAA